MSRRQNFIDPILDLKSERKLPPTLRTRPTIIHLRFSENFRTTLAIVPLGTSSYSTNINCVTASNPVVTLKKHSASSRKVARENLVRSTVEKKAIRCESSEDRRRRRRTKSTRSIPFRPSRDFASAVSIEKRVFVQQISTRIHQDL